MIAHGSKNIVRFATGGAAVGCSLYFARVEGTSNVVVLLASLFFILICIVDTLQTRIPNWANLALIVVGGSYNLYIAGLSGLLISVAGLFVGLLLLIIPYLMGGMGAGDVKALAALGALLGPADIFQVFFYLALIGGVMAVLHYALAHNLVQKCRDGVVALRMFVYSRDVKCLVPSHQGEQLRFPYAAAIAFGFFAFVKWGALV
ncbi:MAG: prepilin peptidase [Desulfuromonas sp.]|nr:prepilin peptidase [Desulfuromonas sp.]